MDQQDQDRKWLEAIAKGDKDKFALLVQKYMKMVYGYSCKLLNDPILADDIAQETWVRVAKYAETYTPIASVSAWIMRICRNLCFDQLRQEKKLVFKEEAPDVADPALSADEQMIDLQNQRAFTSALSSLDDQSRSILLMHMAEQLSYPEIAKELGLSVANIKVIVFRAKKKIAEQVGATQSKQEAK